VPAILNLPGRRLLRFAIGEPPEPVFEPEAHLRWVLDDYGARRAEQWRVPPQLGGLLLTKLYYEDQAAASRARLPATLLAFGFYGMLVGYARHYALEALAPASGSAAMAGARALGSFRRVEVVPELQRALSGPDDSVRRESYLSWAKLARPQDLPDLDQAAVGDSEREAIAEIARLRVAAQARNDTPGYLRATLSHRDFYEDLVGLAKLLVKDLSSLLTTPLALDDLQRRRCFRVLGLARVRDRAAGGQALGLALEPTTDRGLRFESVVYLGRARANAGEPLCAVLDDPDAGLVRATVVALGEIGDSVAIGPLLNHYDSHGGSLRSDVELAAYRMAQPLDDASYDRWAAGELDLTPHSAYFFHGGFSTELPEAEYLARLSHADALVRQESALLLGLLASSAAARPLRDLAIREPDARVSAVALRAGYLANQRK
jgi:hypothetical protein